MKKDSSIYIAGHTGLIGSAITKRLKSLGYKNLILKTHNILDLTNQKEVEKFFKKEHPEYVFVCAGKTGGIYANIKYPADFIYQNLIISINLIHYSYLY
ncbi:MAG: NAD-dependent epimerase/dehydratase family protein, partial [Candidatus Omnitrophica bacterium]|nr:NAD-dependent epimerase/dehydratase family protein [Candidatus Omnitrophota bacterium]